jgi:hypothetical protein
VIVCADRAWAGVWDLPQLTDTESGHVGVVGGDEGTSPTEPQLDFLRAS